MKKTIGILLVICAFLLFLTSCACKTCGGNEDTFCRLCTGKGKENCDLCNGIGDCHDCAQGVVRNTPCSNNNCSYGYVSTSIGRLKCAECDGTGYKESKCSLCDGSGSCFKCDGTGLKENAKTCQNCNGAGRVDCPDCK